MIVIDKIKKHYFLLLSTFLFFYVFFNLLDGERGLISYFEKKEQYKNMLNKKNELTIQISGLEHKISLLTDNIDLDYIETLVREKFFFGQKGEKVYLINNNEN
jgi:cell division protein FtsB|tara:strand:- start:386 stop:694 length:309 start_codon:yes stop_codon:yes gene_type:complete